MENQKLKTCKICMQIESDIVKFQTSRKTCIRCNSKKCNQKLGKEYFRLKMVGRYTKIYEHAGRPKKEIVVEK